jgi:hypothetical protein
MTRDKVTTITNQFKATFHRVLEASKKVFLIHA